MLTVSARLPANRQCRVGLYLTQTFGQSLSQIFDPSLVHHDAEHKLLRPGSEALEELTGPEDNAVDLTDDTPQPEPEAQLLLEGAKRKPSASRRVRDVQEQAHEQQEQQREKTGV